MSSLPKNPDTWVIDASVAMKWYLRDEDLLAEADLFRDQIGGSEIRAVAPHLSRHEMVSSLSVACWQGRIDATIAREDLASYLASGLSLDGDPDSVLQQAISVAVDLRVPAFDAVYIALADSIGGALVTADRRLFDAVGNRLDFVHWLGAVPS